MHLLKSFIIAVCIICCATPAAFAQKGYAPFKYDAEDVMLSMNIKESAWAKKFAPVMQKHHRDPGDVVEWVGVFDIIVGMKDPDLYETGHLTFDSDENIVKISATQTEEADAIMKALRPVIASPDKLDAFLTDFEATLEKAKKKK